MRKKNHSSHENYLKISETNIAFGVGRETLQERCTKVQGVQELISFIQAQTGIGKPMAISCQPCLHENEGDRLRAKIAKIRVIP